MILGRDKKAFHQCSKQPLMSTQESLNHAAIAEVQIRDAAGANKDKL